MKRISLWDAQGNRVETHDGWGPKVAGLLELDTLGLPVPEACVFSLPNGGSAQGLARMLHVLAQWQEEQGWPMVSLRCGAKNNRGALPETVLNLGLAQFVSLGRGAMLPVDYQKRLAQVCTDHAQAFFAFFGQTPPVGFASLPLLEQVQMLVSALGSLFVREVGPESPSLWQGVMVQRMVLGNFDEKSLTGMCYTRNPYTGVRCDYGHYLLNRQGMSLGGIHAPDQLDLATMKDHNPKAYAVLKNACRRLEVHYGDIRCLEYTAEAEDLYFLQNTVGNRTYRLQPAELQTLQRELAASDPDEPQLKIVTHGKNADLDGDAGTKKEVGREAL